MIREELPEIEAYFEHPASRRLGYRLRRRIRPFVRPRIDKFIALLLHLRKHNQLVWDSDRSWPIR